MTPGLIERLEKAEGGSRELDLDLAIQFEAKLWLRGSGRNTVERNGRQVVIPGYSTSLDAALALAERVGWRLYKLDASIISRSSVMLQSVDDRPRVDPDSGATLMGKDFAVGSSKTPALALCIAILKARATQEQG